MAVAARAVPPNRLQELRRLRGLTQNKLAELAEISGQQIGHLERGERRMTFTQAEILAPHLGCAPADLLSHAEGLSIPVTCRIAAAFSESALAQWDISPPQARVPALPGLKMPEECFTAALLDDRAVRLYPSGSVPVARPVGDNIPIGAKIMLRRFTGSGATRKTMEFLVGLLERNGSGYLGLAVCSDNRELPAGVIV
jgi:transcriptional regulator with XRE-family HTH domain